MLILQTVWKTKLIIPSFAQCFSCSVCHSCWLWMCIFKSLLQKDDYSKTDLQVHL